MRKLSPLTFDKVGMVQVFGINRYRHDTILQMNRSKEKPPPFCVAAAVVSLLGLQKQVDVDRITMAVLVEADAIVCLQDVEDPGRNEVARKSECVVCAILKEAPCLGCWRDVENLSSTL